MHGGPDNPEITVTVRSDGDTGVVCVSDRGTGLSHRDSATVFTRFRQLQPGHGSGLGLAIVDEIASLHGGTVAIMDVPVGARVEIALPMARNGTAI